MISFLFLVLGFVIGYWVRKKQRAFTDWFSIRKSKSTEKDPK